MKKTKQKKLTKTEIIREVDKLKKDLFNLRFQKNNGQLKNPAKFKELRKNVARLKTLLKGKDA